MTSLLCFCAAITGALALAFFGRSVPLFVRRIGYIGVVSAVLLTAWLTPSYVLQKGLGRLAMPVGLIWISGFAGVWWTAHTGRRSVSLGLLGLWLAYSVAGNNLVGKSLLWSLESEFVSDSASAPSGLDAVFVLAGGTGRRADGTVQLGRAGDRLVTAARLYRGGDTRHLVYASPDGPRDQTAEAVEIWSLLGVPEEAVHRIRGPYNTRTEVAAFKALAQEQGWSRVGLVTSAWHLRRAMALVEGAEWAAIPYPADVRGRSWRPSFMGIIPSGTGFSRVHVAMWEYVGAALGR